jgi:hypothetical protein
MKSKILSLFLLTSILSILMVTAADFSVTQPASLSKSITSTTFTITNSINESITVTIPQFGVISDGDSHNINLNQDASGDVTINPGSSKTVNISYTLDSGTDLEDLALGNFAKSITITNKNKPNETAAINLNFISSFCSDGDRVQKIEDTTSDTRDVEIISVKDKSSEKDWEWKPLDEVQVDVKVRFNSDDNDDSTDGIIEIGLYDSENNEFIDLTVDPDTQIDVSLDEGESTTETFTITVPVEDLEDSSGRYKLYVKFYEDGEEENICTDHQNSDYYQDIKITKNSYDVVLDNLEITTPVPCGQEIQVSGTAYNIGSHDEDRVIVNIYNKELGIDFKSDPFSLDSGDSKKVSFSFTIPANADEKSYQLRVWDSFRYKKSTDTFAEESEDDFLILKVEGNCKTTTQETLDASITAELDPETPEAIAGQQVIIKANVKNTGTVQTVYKISVLGNNEWSSLSAIDPQTISLNPGDSKNVNVYLDIDKAVTGEKELTIRADYEGKSSEQKVSLSIGEGAVSQDAIITHLRENWFIYVIAIINIILIIAIIAVVKSMVGRSPQR